MTGIALAAALARAADPAPVLQDLADIEFLPGTSEWDEAVAFNLRVAYDRDRSGALDTRREVDAIPCEVLRALDLALASRGGYPGLLAPYGFAPELVWLGDRLGIDARVRRRAERRLATCGLVAEGPLGAPVVDAARQDLVTGMMLGLPDPGSPVWVELARRVLLVSFDADESGAVDDLGELRAIGCAVWLALDEPLWQATGAGLVAQFGLRPDQPFGGEALGIAPDLAPAMNDTARRCALHDAGR